MLWTFDLLGVFTITATVFVIIQIQPVYALLLLIVSFLLMSGMMFLLGAFFTASLEVIIYAGAIMLLFVFIIMMLNVGLQIVNQELQNITFKFWIIPIIISMMFCVILFYLSILLTQKNIPYVFIPFQTIGMHLFSSYLLMIELSSILLLSAIIITCYLSRSKSY